MALRRARSGHGPARPCPRSVARRRAERRDRSAIDSAEPMCPTVKITVGGGSTTMGGCAASTGASVGAVVRRIDSPAIQTAAASRWTVPVTSTHRPVSTRAPGSRSKSFPFGRRPVIQIAASADCRTKSHLLLATPCGRSPNRFPPFESPGQRDAAIVELLGCQCDRSDRRGGRGGPGTKRRVQDDEHLVASRPSPLVRLLDHRAEIEVREPVVPFLHAAEVPELAPDLSLGRGWPLAPEDVDRLARGVECGEAVGLPNRMPEDHPLAVEEERGSRSTRQRSWRYDRAPARRPPRRRGEQRSRQRCSYAMVFRPARESTTASVRKSKPPASVPTGPWCRNGISPTVSASSAALMIFHPKSAA